MRDELCVISGGLAGAAAGSLLAFLLFTARGRRFRAQVEPALEECSQLLVECRGTLRAARHVGEEARAFVEELRMSIAGTEPPATAGAPHFGDSTPHRH